MKKRKRLAGFLILALALAAAFILFRPRPDLVPYTTPWLSNGKEELRIFLLVPANWKGEIPHGPAISWVEFHPVDSDWIPKWARRILGRTVLPEDASLYVDADIYPPEVAGIDDDLARDVMRSFEGGGRV